MQTAAKTLTMGDKTMELGGKYLGSLREATDLLGDAEALRARMAEDGYLLLRKLQKREKVRAARQLILENLDAAGKIDRRYPVSDGVIATDPPKQASKASPGKPIRELTREAAFLALVESPEILGFFGEFLGGEAATFDYKWLRVVGNGGNTGAHFDRVYMGRGTRNLYTVWTPLGDLSLEDGTLALLTGSHKLQPFQRIRETYGEMDVDRDRIEGWFTKDPIEMVDRFGGQWQTSEFEMGDVLIFGMVTMHASLNNTTDRFRLSCDTRFQLASEPMDERWSGDKPIAHSGRSNDPTISMQEARKKWGV